MTGRVHSFQSMGTLDGPGVRFVVFLQGCPLRCPYCHNPDTWDPGAGEGYSAGEVVERILRVRNYLSGGVTVSGGEPLLQADFVLELFRLLKAEGIHTALDTSGCLLPEKLDALLDVTDLVLLDIKMNSDEQYTKWIGIPLSAPLEFLRALDARGVKTWIRQVVIPTIHDAPGEMRSLAGLTGRFSCVEKVELLPFRKLCLEKYRTLGLPFPLEHIPEMRVDGVRALEEDFKLWATAQL